MSIQEWTRDLALMARLANDLSLAVNGRGVVDMNDVGGVTKAFIQRSHANGLPSDSSLDARLAWQATAAATWLSNGGPRFSPSHSVAASFVLTKQQPGEVRLPFNTVLLQLPKGFMPSSVEGEWEGAMMIAKLPTERPMVAVFSSIQRPGDRSGVVSMFFSEDIDEKDVDHAQIGENYATISGIAPTSVTHRNNAAAMTIRIVRNFASWMSAFPTRAADRKNASVRTGEVGASIAHGPVVYLKTEVQLSAEMRLAAKRLLDSKASFEVQKLALRHIVRGHWKRQANKEGHKTIWIAPYWRGPDGPAAWGRVYRMDDKT